MSDLWYYAESDETKGPLGFRDLVEALKRMPRPSEVLVWQQGFKDWAAAGTIPELDRMLVAPPPLPNKRPASPLSPEYRQAQAQTPEEKKTGLKRWGGTIVGWAIGFGFARFLGGVFWIPAILIWLSFFIFAKIKVFMPVALMLAVVVGHTLWMIVGHVSLIMMDKPSDDLPLFAVDLVIVAIATIWCIKKESVSSCVLVLFYQLVVLVINIIFFDEKTNQLAAGVHVGLRVLGVVLAVYAIVKTKQRKLDTEEQLEAV